MGGKKKKSSQKAKRTSSELHEVEAILGVENVNNEPRYNVKWAGWDESWNTWEPYKHVKNCLMNLNNSEEIMEKTREIWRAAGLHDKRLSNASSDTKRSKSKKTPNKRFKGINNCRKIESSSSEDSDDDNDDVYTPRHVDESKCATIPSLQRSSSPKTSAAAAKLAKQPVIDFDAVEKMQYDKNLVPDYIMGVIPNKETNKLYFVIKWKNPLKESVQIVYSKFANKYYPQTVIEFYESKLKFEN